MIEFIHTGKTYPGGVRGLDDVSLKIDQGEFVAIIGLSGAGKSTLIRTVNRMIDATEGQVLVDGVDVMSLKGRALRRFRRKVGMIFQSFNLVSRTTAIKNVLASKVPDMNLFAVLLGLHSKAQKIQALEALDSSSVWPWRAPSTRTLPLFWQTSLSRPWTR
jgi:phosphonate transport system ATP-binding protein